MARNPTARKTFNHIKARLERRRSPVVHDQARSPLEDAIRDYQHRAALSFSIPAHAAGGASSRRPPAGPGARPSARTCR